MHAANTTGAVKKREVKKNQKTRREEVSEGGTEVSEGEREGGGPCYP